MRLIDADPLYAVMKKERDRIAEDYGENDEYVQCLNKYAMSMVSSAPTIDAAPVVRCKDCKYSETKKLVVSSWEGPLEKRDVRFCKYGTPTLFVADIHFCSFGERRDDGES